MEITFDPAKRKTTLSRRGLDFADAAEVFSGSVLEYEDDRFDYGEIRNVTIGILHGKLVVIVWTDCTDTGLETRHIISMREATKGEHNEWFRCMG
jgi:uncharacterized DUF497 family protein